MSRSRTNRKFLFHSSMGCHREQNGLPRGSGMASADQGQPLSEDQINELRSYYGFDKPILQSYVTWLGKVVSVTEASR